MEMWQWILSGIVIALAGQSVFLIRLAQRFRRQRRKAYRQGLIHGYSRCNREYLHARRVELHDAQRLADARPDAGPPARVSNIQFHRRFDT